MHSYNEEHTGGKRINVLGAFQERRQSTSCF
jgi:hypothetical protein